jgi:enamine deaminase RidA (YjgF/YER057c/UK114 family)/rhodanese-related sulfurtransferase
MTDIIRLDSDGRFAQAVVYGGAMHIAGQVADNWDGDIRSQTREVLGKIDRLLDTAGSSRALVLSLTVYLRDFADYEGYNAEYDEWVESGNKPTRATVRAELLDPRLRIEIQATAAVPAAVNASARMVEEADRHVSAMSAEEAVAKATADDVVFVDVRDKEEYSDSTIPGAVHAARGWLEWHLDPLSEYHIPELRSGRRLVMVCGGGGRSSLAARLANSLGIDATYIRGGFRAWQASGGPTTARDGA